MPASEIHFVPTKFFCHLASFLLARNFLGVGSELDMLARESSSTSSRSAPREHRQRVASRPDYTLGRCNRPQVGHRLHSAGSSDKNTEPEGREARL
jgi:hypothetical protein